MPSFDFVYDFICEHFEHVGTRGNQIVARCSLCGDSAKSKRKRRFGLKYDDKNTVFHCYNCGESGSFYKLYAILKKISIEEAFSECESTKNSFDNILKNFLPKQTKSVDNTVPNFNYITQDCLTEYNYAPGILYEAYVDKLKKFRSDRKISTNIPLFIAYKGRYKGRIIIPVYNASGDMIYFQARRTNDFDQPKYLNPEWTKEIVIPNFDFFDSAKPVIITEGLLDCFSIGRQATSCLGKEVDDKFIRRIRTKCKDIIIAMDNDTEGIKATLNVYKSNLYNTDLKYFIMPDKNIKDINEFLVKNSSQNINIYEFVIKNSYSYFNYKVEREKHEINNTWKRCNKY